MKYKDEEKYKRILQATADLIMSDGLANISTTKIAKKANVPQSNLYIYFANKDDILKQVYFEHVHQMSVAVVNKVDPEIDLITQIEQCTVGLYRFAKQQPESIAVIDALNKYPPLKKALLDKTDDNENQRIQNLIKEGIAEKVLKNYDINLIRYFLSSPIYDNANRPGLNFPQLMDLIMCSVLTSDSYLRWKRK